MHIREFLGLESGGDQFHWSLEVRPQLATPGHFLFGGCGLAAAVSALEGASERPTIWASAQYLSYATTGSRLDLEVVLPAVGGQITQGRVTGRVGDREILTVNGSVGTGRFEVSGVWEEPPDVADPEDCPKRELPFALSNSILTEVDVRIARGRSFEDLETGPGEPHTALWARIPGHLSPSAAGLAIFGDYVSGGVSHPIGRRTLGRSLDNTLRMVQVVETEWVLCDIRMHSLFDGIAQGTAFLWSQDRRLLAIASQSLSVRGWPPG